MQNIQNTHVTVADPKVRFVCEDIKHVMKSSLVMGSGRPNMLVCFNTSKAFESQETQMDDERHPLFVTFKNAKIFEP